MQLAFLYRMKRLCSHELKRVIMPFKANILKNNDKIVKRNVIFNCQPRISILCTSHHPQSFILFLGVILIKKKSLSLPPARVLLNLRQIIDARHISATCLGSKKLFRMKTFFPIQL